MVFQSGAETLEIGTGARNEKVGIGVLWHDVHPLWKRSGGAEGSSPVLDEQGKEMCSQSKKAMENMFVDTVPRWHLRLLSSYWPVCPLYSPMRQIIAYL